MFLFFNGEPASKCSSFIYSYVSSKLSTLRELIFTKTDFREKTFNLLFLFSGELVFPKKPAYYISRELS